MIRKVLAISMFIFYVAYAAETTALSEKNGTLNLVLKE